MFCQLINDETLHWYSSQILQPIMAENFMLICKPQSGYITRLFNSDTLCMDAEAKVYLHNTYIVTDKTYNLRSTHFKTKSKCKNHNCFLLLMSISRHLSNWHSLAGCSIMFKLLNIMKYRKKYTPASSSL